MAKKAAALHKQFMPLSYRLALSNGLVTLTLRGRKLPPPSKRLTLHQEKLKIISAELIHHAKKESRTIGVIHINHLPTFQEVRLHTKEILYPGDYELTIEYALDKTRVDALGKLDGRAANRTLVPSIDEAAGWKNADLEIKQ